MYAFCILYQAYHWYTHRIWHISQWRVCYMPSSVFPDTHLNGIWAYTIYTICYTKLYLHTRMLYHCIGMLYYYIATAATSCVPSRVTPLCKAVARMPPTMRQSMMSDRVAYGLNCMWGGGNYMRGFLPSYAAETDRIMSVMHTWVVTGSAVARVETIDGVIARVETINAMYPMWHRSL